jgi:hypothetical protein
MVIEFSTTNHQEGKNIAKKVGTVTAYGLLVTFGVITTITVIGSSSSPTGTYLSPLPKGEIAQSKPSPTPETTPTQAPKTTAELINLAQNYLDKAFILAQDTPQTDDQKKKIVDTLDQSLNLTTQVINQNPQNPKGYVLRAQILTAVSKTNPNALSQAQKDLETAQSLSQGEAITLPETINPLNLLPDQKALADSDLILASPDDSSTSTASGEIVSNSFTTTATLLANQQETVIKDPRIDSSSYIYLIPQEPNNMPVFVKAKGEAQFTLASTSSSNEDTFVDYYIINP